MKFYKLNEIKNKRILGRNVCNAEKKEFINLFWAASALEINVKSSEVWAEFCSDYRSAEPWVSIFLNGAKISRFMIEKGEPKKVCLVRGLNPQSENVISIYKDTQPMPDDDGITQKNKNYLFNIGITISDENKKVQKYHFHIFGKDNDFWCLKDLGNVTI